MRSPQSNHKSWSQVDASDDPSFFVRFLDVSRRPILAAARADPNTYFAHLDIHRGQRILDAACGTGDLTSILATLIAPDGEAVGLDFSATMVAEASRRVQGKNLPVTFIQGDIMTLPFAPKSFDRTRAEQVLQHIASPQTAVVELARVTRSGGIVAVMEPDWETLIIDADNLPMSRTFAACHSATIVPNGSIGRRLPALFREAGLIDVDVTGTVLMPPYPPLKEWITSSTKTMVAEGAVSQHEAEEWLDDLERRNREDRFFAAFSYFRVSGRVP